MPPFLQEMSLNVLPRSVDLAVVAQSKFLAPLSGVAAGGCCWVLAVGCYVMGVDCWCQLLLTFSIFGAQLFVRSSEC